MPPRVAAVVEASGILSTEGFCYLVRLAWYFLADQNFLPPTVGLWRASQIRQHNSGRICPLGITNSPIFTASLHHGAPHGSGYVGLHVLDKPTFLKFNLG